MSIQNLRSLVNSGVSVENAVKEIYPDGDSSLWARLLSLTPKAKKKSRGGRSGRAGRSFNASSVLSQVAERNRATAELVTRANVRSVFINGDLHVWETDND